MPMAFEASDRNVGLETLMPGRAGTRDHARHPDPEAGFSCDDLVHSVLTGTDI